VLSLFVRKPKVECVCTHSIGCLGKNAGSLETDEKKSEIQEPSHDEGVLRKKRKGNVLNTDEVEKDTDRSSTFDKPKNEELENCPVCGHLGWAGDCNCGWAGRSEDVLFLVKR